MKGIRASLKIACAIPYVILFFSHDRRGRQCRSSGHPFTEWRFGLLLREMLLGRIPFALSPAIVLEYEDVLKRPGLLGHSTSVSSEDIDFILDGLCAQAVLISPWFRYRPFLNDPKDDLFIECALAAGASVIVTYDRHFDHPAVARFGLVAMSSQDFVRRYKTERK